MKRNTILGAALFAALTAAIAARAQTYSNAVMNLNPAAYWPLSETTPPPQPLDLTAHNLGSLGSSGNGYYGAWYQPSGSTWYITNNVAQTNGITFANDSDTALWCQSQPGQYVIVPRNTNGAGNPAITLVPPFTIETWALIGATNSANRTLVSEGQVPLNIGGSDTNNPYYGGTGTGWAGFPLGQYQDYFYLSCFCTNAVNNKSSELDTSGYNKWQGVKVGQWVYVMATFDGTTETVWTNGVVAASKNVSANGAGLKYVPDPTSPLMIGSGNIVPLTSGQNTFSGALDEVAIYTNVLPATSIQNHFETAYGTNATYGANYTNAVLADNPILYYRLDELQSNLSDPYPSSTFPTATNYGSLGAAADGVYQPGTTPGVSGPSYAGFGAGSKAVAINGWFGAVDVGGGNLPAELNPTTNVPLSVVTWFRSGPADAPGRFQNILGHGDNSYRMALGQTAGENHFNAGHGPELQFANPADVATNGFAFNDGRWHMAAGVFDGTNEYMYLDGALAKSAVVTNAIIGSTNDLLLGGDSQYTYASASSGNTIKDFDGEVAQVAFWTNALSAADIQSLFSAAGVPPYIWQQTTGATLDAGQNVTLSVGARGSALKYQWYQNDSPVTGQTNASLVYAPSEGANAGSYYVVASNADGMVTSAVVSLTIYSTPVITSQTPKAYTNLIALFAGANPTFSVSAVGRQPISYQWLADGNPVADATNASFTYTNIQSGGPTHFKCVLTNLDGSATSMVWNISVLAAPTAAYPAAVLAAAPIGYWRLNEGPDDGNGNQGALCHDYVSGNDGIYTNVNLGQSPGYSQATEPGVTSTLFGLTGLSFFDSDADQIEGIDFSAPTNSSVAFSVEAWINGYQQTSDAGLVTKGYGNGGEQFCLGFGTNSAVGAETFRFLVRDTAGNAYVIKTGMAPVYGNWYHLVGVCDEPNGLLTLYVNGEAVGTHSIGTNVGILSSTNPVTIGSRMSGAGTDNDSQFVGYMNDVAIYNHALTFSQVAAQYYDAGIAAVITQAAPVNVTTNQGSDVTFEVAAGGTPPLTYQWYDPNSNPLSGATNSTLVLTNLQQSQSGMYSVTVNNAYGSASTNFSLNVVLGPPQITQDLQPTSWTGYAGTPLTYSIVVSGSQPLHYQWYQDGMAVLDETNSSYSFDVLLGTHTYYCSVTNAYSSGPTVSSTATVNGIAPTTVDPAGFNSRLKITFSGYDRNETLSDFPVLVRLSTNVPGFSYSEFASPSGGDLRFADSSGTRELPSEIDQWNDSNGVSSVWVQVPSLSSINDFIWAYWGNPSDTTPPDSQTNGAVWLPPSFQTLPAYDVVYHLKEDGFPYADSTTQYPSTNGTAAILSGGIVGSGELFAGTNYLDAQPVSLGSTFTLSAWVNLSPTASHLQTVWANSPGGWNSDGFRFYLNSWTGGADGMLILEIGDGTGGNTVATAAGAVSAGAWHCVTAAIDHDGGTAKLYVDGVQEAADTILNDFATNVDLNLGQFTNNAGQFNGSIDEARIQAGVESANWIWASYMTVAQNSQFATYSTVSNTVPLSVNITIQLSGNNVVLSWPQGTLQSASQAAGPYSDVLSATSPYTNTVSGAQEFYRIKVQ
ncbi:MAG: DUF2341 domain-containing protein [Verrucomicrobiota bacterium]|nr:DUF2341 domain-containing protein [Verrucomicrobiota bacterium]